MKSKSLGLAAVLDGLPAEPIRRERVMDESRTVLVGANLSPRYAKNIALLHAETGMTKKEILQEAL